MEGKIKILSITIEPENCHSVKDVLKFSEKKRYFVSLSEIEQYRERVKKVYQKRLNKEIRIYFCYCNLIIKL